eukprot:4769955-Amphidinium_carterae.1
MEPAVISAAPSLHCLVRLSLSRVQQPDHNCKAWELKAKRLRASLSNDSWRVHLVAEMTRQTTLLQVTSGSHRQL